MGDIILATPLFRWIRQSYPNACLNVLVKSEYESLFDNHPDVHEILTWPKKGGLKDLIYLQKKIRRRHYDVVIDIQANIRSHWLAMTSTARSIAYYRPQRLKRFLHIYLRCNFLRKSVPVTIRYLESIKSLGILDDGSGAALFPTPTAKRTVRDLIKGATPDRIIVLAPGAAHETKRWPLPYYTELGQVLQAEGFFIALIGGENDHTVCQELSQALESPVLNLVGKLKLIDSAALLQQSRLLVTNDTGVMHMAGAVGTPVVAIFGPTTRQLGFFPFRSRSVIIEQERLPAGPVHITALHDVQKNIFNVDQSPHLPGSK